MSCAGICQRPAVRSGTRRLELQACKLPTMWITPVEKSLTPEMARNIRGQGLRKSAAGFVDRAHPGPPGGASLVFGTCSGNPRR